MIEQIIQQIEEQAKLRGMAESTLCFHAVNDGKLVNRLRNGGTINLKTVERLQEYFSTPLPPKVEAEQRASA